MHFEIERKFLVTGEFRDQVFDTTYIRQGYITASATNVVRVRIRGEKAWITIKGPSTEDGLKRYEFEQEISLADAHDLMDNCAIAIVEKKRHLVHHGQYTIEIDEFLGENSGLIVAEIEMEKEDEKLEMPPFLGKEVTGDVRFYNAYLCHHPYAYWKERL